MPYSVTRSIRAHDVTFKLKKSCRHDSLKIGLSHIVFGRNVWRMCYGPGAVAFSTGVLAQRGARGMSKLALIAGGSTIIERELPTDIDLDTLSLADDAHRLVIRA